jgi:hypothetical protein
LIGDFLGTTVIISLVLTGPSMLPVLHANPHPIGTERKQANSLPQSARPHQQNQCPSTPRPADIVAPYRQPAEAVARKPLSQKKHVEKAYSHQHHQSGILNALSAQKANALVFNFNLEVRGHVTAAS